jgi:hypothetical protein
MEKGFSHRVSNFNQGAADAVNEGGNRLHIPSSRGPVEN